ncbi:MAG: hypothetical protein GX247_01345 [Mollicutes bacterium]|nr:hypothetical protein [Mollicutes bacterium]
MKYKLFLLFALISAVCLIPRVWADDTKIDTGIGSGSGAVFKECEGTLCYYIRIPSDSSEIRQRVSGFRISVVDSEGNRVTGTKSFDMIRSSAQQNELTSSKVSYKFFKEKRTKLEIISQKPGKSLYTAKAGNKYVDLFVDTDIPNYMDENADPNGVHKYFTETIGRSDSKKEKFKKWLFERANYDYEKNKKANHFLMVEPLAFLRLTKKANKDDEAGEVHYYFGTVTEVAYMVKKDGFSLWHADCKEKTKDQTKYVTGIFGRLFPFSIYTKKSIIDGELKTVIAGLAAVDEWAAQNDEFVGNPSGKGLKCASNEILTTNGVAAGPVWLRDLFDPCEGADPIKDYLLFPPYSVPGCCNYENKKTGEQPYKDLEICKSLIPSPCSPSVNCPNSCFDSKRGKGTIKDSENWEECFFDDKQTPEVSNRFCKVYCRETITYQFPIGGFTVKAGSHFTVGVEYEGIVHWSPVNFVGNKECQTQYINWQSFKSQWEDANRKVADKWDEYQVARLRRLALENVTSKKDYSSCDCINYDYIDGRKIDCCKDAERICEEYECKLKNKDDPNICDEYDKDNCKKYKYQCKTGRKDNTRETAYFPDNNILNDKVYGPITGLKSYYCRSVPLQQYKNDEINKKNAYNQALNYRNSLETEINQCSDWKINNYDKEFSPIIKFYYEEPFYKIGEFELNKEMNETRQSYYYQGKIYSSSSYTMSLNNKYVCDDSGSDNSGKKCTTTKMIFPINDKVEKSVTIQYDYKLPNNFYRFVAKKSGKSISESELYKYSPKQYKDIGHSNLPVHYNRPNGKYDIKLIIESLGNNNKFKDYIKNNKCSNRYDCQYQVNNEFMIIRTPPNGSNPEGINLVFRVVSLSNPFPGKYGTGRNVGKNWKGNETIITKNRNLNIPERIYFDRKPMYEITLTPSSISEIRRYNRTRNNYDGYADFELTCEDNTGQKCRSDFIKKFTIEHPIFNTNSCGMYIYDWNKCANDDRGVK